MPGLAPGLLLYMPLPGIFSRMSHRMHSSLLQVGGMCPPGDQRGPQRGHLGCLPAETAEIMNAVDRGAIRMRILSLGNGRLGGGAGADLMEVLTTV